MVRLSWVRLGLLETQGTSCWGGARGRIDIVSSSANARDFATVA